jgi:hypothetical protein
MLMKWSQDIKSSRANVIGNLYNERVSEASCIMMTMNQSCIGVCHSEHVSTFGDFRRDFSMLVPQFPRCAATGNRQIDTEYEATA